MEDMLSLEKRIETELISYNGKMGIYIDDLKGHKIEFNSLEKFETASSIKSFILVDLFEQAESGAKDLNEILKYEEEDYVDGSGVLNSLDVGVEMTAINLARLMIIVSDNVATNIIIRYLGI